jgi:hypothetical protein
MGGAGSASGGGRVGKAQSYINGGTSGHTNDGGDSVNRTNAALGRFSFNLLTFLTNQAFRWKLSC